MCTSRVPASSSTPDGSSSIFARFRNRRDQNLGNNSSALVPLVEFSCVLHFRRKVESVLCNSCHRELCACLFHRMFRRPCIHTEALYASDSVACSIFVAKPRAYCETRAVVNCALASSIVCFGGRVFTLRHFTPRIPLACIVKLPLCLAHKFAMCTGLCECFWSCVRRGNDGTVLAGGGGGGS